MINVKTHIRALRLGIILPLFLFLFMVGITGSVSARSGACPDGSLYTNAPDNIPIEEICADHMQSNSNENEVNTFYVTPVNDCEDCISKDIELVINTLSVGVGVVAVAMILLVACSTQPHVLILKLWQPPNRKLPTPLLA